MNKAQYQLEQLSYIRSATRYYDSQLETDSNLASSNEHYRHAKWRRRMQIMARLRLELLKLTPADFSKSSIRCDCGRCHNKLQAGGLLICPISLGIGWIRLYLNGYNIPDFEIEKLLDVAR